MMMMMLIIQVLDSRIKTHSTLTLNVFILAYFDLSDAVLRFFAETRDKKNPKTVLENYEKLKKEAGGQGRFRHDRPAIGPRLPQRIERNPFETDSAHSTMSGGDGGGAAAARAQGDLADGQ